MHVKYEILEARPRKKSEHHSAVDGDFRTGSNGGLNYWLSLVPARTCRTTPQSIRNRHLREVRARACVGVGVKLGEERGGGSKAIFSCSYARHDDDRQATFVFLPPSIWKNHHAGNQSL